MKENTKKGVSRREFLGLSALGLASLTILPSWAIDGVRIAPSDRVVLGFIGLGTVSSTHLLRLFYTFAIHIAHKCLWCY